RPPSSSRFPYTPLFRSCSRGRSPPELDAAPRRTPRTSRPATPRSSTAAWRPCRGKERGAPRGRSPPTAAAGSGLLAVSAAAGLVAAAVLLVHGGPGAALGLVLGDPALAVALLDVLGLSLLLVGVLRLIALWHGGTSGWARWKGRDEPAYRRGSSAAGGFREAPEPRRSPTPAPHHPPQPVDEDPGRRAEYGPARRVAEEPHRALPGTVRAGAVGEGDDGEGEEETERGPHAAAPGEGPAEARRAQPN